MKFIGPLFFSLSWSCAAAANAQFYPENPAQSAHVNMPTAVGGEKPLNFIAIGLGTAPKYPGASHYSPIPSIGGDVTVHGVELLVTGPNARADPIHQMSGLNRGGRSLDGILCQNGGVEHH